MAKKLINANYTFDASAKKITVPGYVKGEDLLLITDVTNNKIIYNFADATRGYDSATFNSVTEETTITLSANVAALGCNDSDAIQIIVDKPSNEVDFHESYIDPVHKLRVSTPENLIDTDFEYGLQPTKWETLELSNNVPSFYVAEGDLALTSVVRVEALSGSDIVKVVTSEETGLQAGTPVDIQGLSSRTAEGKYLITSADSSGFTYQAAATQTTTGDIGSIYTSIVPGTFYTGSSINYNVATGLATDNKTVDSGGSTIEITTLDEHGFVDNSSFYLVNTVGQLTTNFQDVTDSSAPDGRPFVDDSDTIATTLSVDLTKTNTTQIRSRHHLKFSSSAVNTSANTITWTGHGMRDNDCVLYLAPSGDTPISGLTNFTVYYIKKVDDNTIKLDTSRSGSGLSFASAGTSLYGRHSLHLVYELERIDVYYRNYNTYWYSEAYRNAGIGSGWDLASGQTQLGSGTVLTNFLITHGTTGNIYWATGRNAYPYFDTRYNGNFQLATGNNPPSIYNFVEDWTRFSTFNFSNYRWNTTYSHPNGGYWYTSGKYYWDGTYYLYPNGNTSNSGFKAYIFPVVTDEEADTFYSQSHGLSTNDTVALSTTAGNSPLVHNGTTSVTNGTASSSLADGNYTVERVTDDRFKISNQRIMQATGTYELDAIVANATANSFYVQDHGFNQNQEVNFSLGAGATIPSTTTGQILPDYSTNTQNSTLPKYYTILNDAIDKYFTDNSITTNDMVFANHSGGSPQVFSNSISASAAPISNFTLYYTTHIGYNNAVGQRNISSTNLNVSNFSPTAPYNIWQGTGLDTSGRGFNIVATQFSQNTTTDKYLWVGGVNFANSTEYGYTYFRAGAQMPSAGSFNFYSNYTNRSYNTTNGSGNNYRYAITTFLHTYGTLDFLYVQVKFKNYSDWNTRTANTYYTSTTNGNTYWYAQDTTSGSYYIQDELQFGVCLLMPNTQTGIDTNNEVETFVQAVLEEFDINAVYQGLINNTTYNVNVINSNRFSLNSTSGGSLNLIDKGTAPFVFETPNVLGILDGSYSADSASGTSIKIKRASQQIGGQKVTTDATVANSAVTVSGSNYHSLASGTGVTYTTDSDAAAYGNLTNGNTYYISVIDDQNFQLAATADEALSSSNLINITDGVASATHQFSTASIAGITKAIGTIDVTAGDGEIVGTETLFRRYFKPGDNIHIKDNNATPGQLKIFEVTTVASDTRLTVSPIPDFSASDTDHLVESKVYAKPDGFAVHRPFDGGVEIAAGTAPGSQIARQTRKYFRYQSGKGIQTSLAINFNPPVTLDTLSGSGTTATATTKYPHRLTENQTIEIKNASDSTYNGVFAVSIVDDFTFTYTTDSQVITSNPGGIIKYNLRNYKDAYTRAGMFDFQNGFFFEYDGTALNCVRRSSVEQLSGTCNVVNGRGIVTGVNTKFITQLNAGDQVVLRGQSHKVVRIVNNTEMYVTPQYKGLSTSGVIITKTVDTKVPQSQWNIDKCDGTGPEGFILDIDKIQMAYMDYSWYGAGKIRFGFKDREGHVRYVHQFIHNNRLDEAYMRSGNLPAKYEIENGNSPTYAPTLFHWGTSVIMDGTFDDDKAYLFTAQGKSLTFTNGDINQITTTGNSSLTYVYTGSWWTGYNWYVRIPFSTNDASNFYNGLKMYTSGGELNGEEVAYTQYSGNTFYVYIYIQTSRRAPGSYPSVPSGTAVDLGSSASVVDTVDLGTAVIPLVSLRLAPSVDGNITGSLGERDIINRMQLKLKETGLILTHDCEVKLILNGNLSNTSWQQVNNPSLSELIQHDVGDTVQGGTEIFSFRASGGTTDNTGARLSNTSDFQLGDIIDLGNSILGGDDVFPNGPDILTVAVSLVDTAGINADNPFKTSSRITWSESQA